MTISKSSVRAANVSITMKKAMYRLIDLINADFVATVSNMHNADRTGGTATSFTPMFLGDPGPFQENNYQSDGQAVDNTGFISYLLDAGEAGNRGSDNNTIRVNFYNTAFDEANEAYYSNVQMTMGGFRDWPFNFWGCGCIYGAGWTNTYRSGNNQAFTTGCNEPFGNNQFGGTFHATIMYIPEA